MVKAAGKIVYYGFIGFLVVIALAIAGSVFPITGNYKILVVQSGSMEPAIHTGAVVVVKPSSEYQQGDIITFGPATKKTPPITHRIVNIEGQGRAATYQTKGDANENADPNPVPSRDVLGKVIFNVPYIGYVIDFARQPIGFALIIGIPALVIIGDEMRKIMVEARRLLKQRHAKADKLPTTEENL
ncbi:MAG TPA: signal peptidase I [Candidatus Paceibacterota bacterium]|nr:signal peptidase I [Candidatus Paceibacterota bacterium]